MSRKNWLATPRDTAACSFDAHLLTKQWPRLHRGDCEPFPTAESLAHRAREERTAPDEVAAAVQDAWRAFHQGNFQQAFKLGSQVGLPGFAVSLKAAGIYASEVETDDREAQNLLLDMSRRAEEITERLPSEPNAHYLLAFALGRYSQRISVLAAIAQGFAGRISDSLDKTLKLAPRHSDAHVALGLYHAEIVSKLGSFAAGLTYGASAAKAVEHFKKALKLNPDAPVIHLEYANGLRLLGAKEHAREIDKLLEQAVRCEPADAMECLDRERARAHLR
jgi:tetratricopeptide (TPR) repeat protein